MNSDEAAATRSAAVLAIGDFRLDRKARQLRRADGSEVELGPRLFDALLFFVEHPDQLLDKNTLLTALWPGLVVEDNNLNQLVLALRRALEDDAQAPRYIQTVPRRGFRFIADVRPAGDRTVAAGPAAAVRTAPVAARRRWHRRVVVTSVVVALLVAGALGIALRPSPPTPAAPTLAVLPFRPLAPSAGDDALELAMADSLIVRMSSLPGLVVRSVGSVSRYTGVQHDPLRAAHELNVRWIVDGSVQRWEDRIRVTARLLDATDGQAAWSGSFDDEWKDVFGVQDRIAERVALALAPRLGANATGASWSARTGTRNPDAYQHYLIARHLAQGLQPNALARSIELYHRAAAADPGYALAHTGLADAYRRMAIATDARPADISVPARQAAQRALQLDPALADGHSALGWVRWWYDWDWPGAEQAFRRAIELNPNLAEAHFGLGHLLCSQQRCDDGFAHVQRARELDPLSLIVNVVEASYLLQRGRPEDSRARLERAMQIEPAFWPAWQLLAGLQLDAGRTEEAKEALHKARSLSPASVQPAANLGTLLALTGQPAAARELLSELTALSHRRYVPPAMIASVHCALREHDLALHWLERAHAERDVNLPFLTRCSVGLKDDPRFAALRVRLQLPALRDGFCAPLQAPTVACR
jgi:DNA-binding winged helix-turn-helix (wHTH) protein/TolB-like protein/Tfp pilus assembly protein PilF